jgi:hypothetical protein
LFYPLPASGIMTWPTVAIAFEFDYDGSGKVDHLAVYRPGGSICALVKNNSSGNYCLTENIAVGPNQQADWMWCKKCQALTIGGNLDLGACAAGGRHDHTDSGKYFLTENVAAGPDQQADWMWCNKCQALTFRREPQPRRLPARCRSRPYRLCRGPLVHVDY